MAAMVATSCDLNAPMCAATAQQVCLHGSRPPWDPGDPLLEKIS